MCVVDVVLHYVIACYVMAPYRYIFSCFIPVLSLNIFLIADILCTITKHFIVETGTWMFVLGSQLAEGNVDTVHELSRCWIESCVCRLLCGFISCIRVHLWSTNSTRLNYCSLLVQLAHCRSLAAVGFSQCCYSVLHHGCQVRPSWKTSGYVLLMQGRIFING